MLNLVHVLVTLPDRVPMAISVGDFQGSAWEVK